MFKKQVLISCLVIKTCIAILLVLYYGIGLAPDEAQYWTWSEDLAWGYYSKPPGIAWQIALGTEIFGNTVLGVRIIAVIFGSLLLPLALYRLALVAGTSVGVAICSALIISFCPLGIMASFAATTDAGAIFFWILAATVIAKSLDQKQPPSFVAFGLLIACGALFKWTIFLLWPCVFLTSLRSKKMLVGIALSLIGLLPSIIWNAQHDWPTFRHVFHHNIVGHEVGTKKWGNFFEFLGAQFGVLSPVIFVLLCLAFITLIKKRQSLPPSLTFLGWINFGFLLLYLVISIFKKMQPNWVVFAYPTGIVFMAYCFYHAKKTLYIALLVSLFLSAFMLSIPYLQRHSIGAIPFKINGFRQSLGWNLLTAHLSENQGFTFSDNYQMASILSFYSANQKRAYLLNLNDARNNQFSYWPSMEDECVGKNGLFVVEDHGKNPVKDLEKRFKMYESVLSQYFDQIIFLKIIPLFSSNGQVVKAALLIHCETYNGKMPQKSKQY